MIPPSGKGGTRQTAHLECAKTFGATPPALAKYCGLARHHQLLDPAQIDSRVAQHSLKCTREKNSRLAMLECGEALQKINKRLILKAALGDGGRKRLKRSISISMPGMFRLEYKVPVPALVVLARAPPVRICSRVSAHMPVASPLQKGCPQQLSGRLEKAKRDAGQKSNNIATWGTNDVDMRT